jgi:PAS domain S-box-containing protein
MRQAGCPHCAAREAELQEAREHLAMLRSDLEVAERGAQEALRDLETSREQCAGLYDFAPNAYIMLDRAGFIRDANVAAADLLGEDRLKLRGTLFMRFVDGKDRRGYFRHLSSCRKSRYPAKITTDLNLVCGDGRREVHMISAPDSKADPVTRQIHCRTALVDLSDIRHAERALRDSESRYRLLFEANPCPMFIFDENTLAFLDVNEAALQLYGYSREAFLGMTIKDIRPQAEVPTVVVAIRAQRRILKSGTAKGQRPPGGKSGEGVPLSAGEWRHERRDGTVFDAAITISSIQYAGRLARLVLVNEITTRKQTEAALRDFEARYRTIFEQAADAVVVFDPKTLNILDFNDEACRRLGYSRKEFAKLKVTDFEVIESAKEAKRHAQNVEMNGVEVFETKHRTKRGTVLDIEIRAKAICLGGKILIQGIWRDITGRKQTEDALQYRVTLEQLLAAVSSRLVNVSTSNLDTAVNEVLADVGRLLRTDRCYLFRLDENLAVADNTHEWCAPGIHAQIADLRNIPTAKFRWMMKRLRDGEPLYVPHVADIPSNAVAERQLMEQGHVQSVILVPIRHGGKLTGFIGCDVVRGERHWHKSDVRLLRIVGEIIAATQVRCRADEAVRSAASEWQRTFDSVADAVWVLDADQRIQRCNKSATALFGKTAKDMVGCHCWEIVHGTRRPIPECPFACMSGSRHRESMDLEIDGRWYQVVVDPLIAPNGELHGAVHIVSDITARKQTAETLRNMATELERRVMERTAALRMANQSLQQEIKQRQKLEHEVLEISEHEQRRIGQDLHDGVGQSLVGIGYLISAVQEMLVSKAAVEAAELGRVTRLIGEAAHQLREMARGLFPGEMKGRIFYSLQDLARHTQEIFGTACSFRGRQLRLSDANTASQLYRVAQEAVNNAVKYSKAKTIRIGLSQRHGRIILTVRDTGVGLVKTKGKSDGMGQRIMKYRANMIGATFKVESVHGKGTTVTCVLPASSQPHKVMP